MAFDVNLIVIRQKCKNTLCDGRAVVTTYFSGPHRLSYDFKGSNSYHTLFSGSVKCKVKSADRSLNF
jgi:hypothetical protein